MDGIDIVPAKADAPLPVDADVVVLVLNHVLRL